MDVQTKIRITITDDHPVVAEGLHHLLSAYPQLDVISIYLTGAALLAGLAPQTTDVLLLDIQLPDIRGNELVRQLVPAYPALRILAVTSVDSIYEVRNMMQLGCHGYVLKSTALPVLVTAIEEVYRGGTFVDATLREELSLLLSNEPSTKGRVNYELTQREKSILSMLSEGYTNNEIAAKLFLSHRTIENNRLSLYQKLEVKNTGALITKAILLGLIG